MKAIRDHQGKAAMLTSASASSPAPSSTRADMGTHSRVPPREGRARAPDGIPIHYVTAGLGPTAVVLVHSWGYSSVQWQGTIEHLAPSTRVVALDLAGHGESGRARKTWTVAAFAQDVKAVVDALGLQRVVLVGHSMGGPIIVDAALAMPGRVVGLVPVDTLKDLSESPTAEDRAKFFAPLRADFRRNTGDFLRHLFPKDADPAVIERVVSQTVASDPAIAIPMLEATFAWPAERVALVNVPVASVQGDLLPTKVASNRKVAPRYQAFTVAGTGHWPMLEKPEAFYAALDQALAVAAE